MSRDEGFGLEVCDHGVLDLGTSNYQLFQACTPEVVTPQKVPQTRLHYSRCVNQCSLQMRVPSRVHKHSGAKAVLAVVVVGVVVVVVVVIIRILIMTTLVVVVQA